ncbi:multicopper oxidase domain-containing protein [Paenibacillus jiagnxiensis]|uniref:multicopper oxidase domain-containing protein n=1 Tax=Paenibacillus jiagnxiensis TaxID=3228926 RepID=UPI0033B6D7FC
MFRHWLNLFIMIAVFAVLVLTGCESVPAHESSASTETAQPDLPEEKLDQPPVKPVIRKEGDQVYVDLTAQVTDIEIAKGTTYHAWTFNGTVPGPVLRVKEGDTIHMTLRNLDPNLPHSMDMHAVQAAPSKHFIDVNPGEDGTFKYKADNPGVFMYHCGTKPVLQHLANGMYGMIIVEPAAGYPTDKIVDREYTIVQSEFYKENDLQAFSEGEPTHVVFNGSTEAMKDQPFAAKVGDRVRFYVVNAGPNHVSSFHIVGAILDRVYLDGNPHNVLQGMQTVLIPAGGGVVIETEVNEEGEYTIVTHQFNDADRGATATLSVTR